MEEENGRLMDERLSLVMELGATKEDFAAFREKSSSEKSALKADFDASGDVIFNYGYGCWAFAHDIRGEQTLDPSQDAGCIDCFDSRFFYESSMPPGLFICLARCRSCRDY